MPESDRSRFWLAAEGVLAVSLVALPASLGGAPEWTAWLLLALSGSALLLWVLGAARNHRRWGWHALLFIPALVVVVGLLQLVPLPPAVLAVISPRQAQLRDFALVPLGLDAWRPIAVDAPATAKGVARVLSLAMLFFVALELSRVNGVRRRLLSVLALSGVATALCGFVHLLAEVDALFGVVHFYGVVPFLTPFGNTNHLAAWLLLSGTVALGLAMNASTRDGAVGWAVAAVVCGTGVFFSFSRGGIASFVATWAVVGVVSLARRAGGLRAVFPWVVIGGTVLLAGALSFEQLVERAETLSSLEKLRATKLELWPQFMAGIGPYWRGGMGLGGFELGFAPAQTSEFTVTFTHPETWWLQWPADVGLPVAVFVLLFALWRAWSLWGVARAAALERTALLGVAGLAVHDLFDFALELNAVAPAAVVVLGLVCGLEAPGRRFAVKQRGLLTAFAPVAAGAWLLAFGLPGFMASERALASEINDGRGFPEVRARALKLIDRHPADWVLYSNVAQLAARGGDPREALAWINRVLALRPRDAASHVSAAQALLRLGRPQQALGELKLAWESGDQRSLALGLEVAAKLGLWERVVLDRPGHLTEAYSLLRRLGRVGDAKSLLDAAALLPPSDAVAEEAAVLKVLHEVDLGTPEAALLTLDALAPATRQRGELVRARVRALQRLSRYDEAIAALEAYLNRQPADVSVAFLLVDALAAAGRPAAAREVLQRIRPFATSSGQRSAAFQKEAEQWVVEERFPRALDALQTASRIEPGSAQLHYRLAAVYERMGSLHSAVDEVRRGRLLDSPEGARSKDEWISRLEASMGQLP